MKFDRLKWLPNYRINLLRKSKPKLRAVSIVLCSFVTLVLVFLFSDKLTSNQATIIGVAGSTIFAISVFFLSRSNEDNQAFITARRQARVLSEIISHVLNEMSMISNGHLYRVNFPKDWLSIYTGIASYLEYDYLSVLIKEFAFAETINELIAIQDRKQIQLLIEAHRKRLLSSWSDYSIYDTQTNLLLFSYGEKEKIHWTKSPSYMEFYNSFKEMFRTKTHELTIEFLKQNDGSCDESDAATYVLERIKSDPLFHQLPSHGIIEDKELLLPIFHMHCDSKDESTYSLCWGQLTLSDKSNSNN